MIQLPLHDVGMLEKAVLGSAVSVLLIAVVIPIFFFVTGQKRSAR